MLLALTGLVTAGLEATTRMRYPVPAAWFVGIVTGMLPAAVAVTVPITCGEPENTPAASDNCAVNVLPVKNAQLLTNVYATLKVAPAQ